PSERRKGRLHSMTDLLASTSLLSPARRELLGALLEAEGSSFNSFPLSFPQQRLWFLEQLDPGSAAYHVPAALRLRGELRQDVLRRSLEALVERHESLRTTFI